MNNKKYENDSNKKDVKDIILEYYQMNEALKAMSKEVEEIKKSFYSAMDEVFKESESVKKRFKMFADNLSDDLALIITKTSKKSVEFKLDKIQEKFKDSKELLICFINKRYIINDYKGLSKYLKSINADPKIIKKFIDVESFVNTNAIERAVNAGDIMKSDLEGCYDIKEGKVYYSIREDKDGK